MKSLRYEIKRCTKKDHPLHLRIRLTQTPNLEILSLKIDRSTAALARPLIALLPLALGRSRSRVQPSNMHTMDIV